METIITRTTPERLTKIFGKKAFKIIDSSMGNYLDGGDTKYHYWLEREMTDDNLKWLERFWRNKGFDGTLQIYVGQN